MVCASRRSQPSACGPRYCRGILYILSMITRGGFMQTNDGCRGEKRYVYESYFSVSTLLLVQISQSLWESYVVTLQPCLQDLEVWARPGRMSQFRLRAVLFAYVVVQYEKVLQAHCHYCRTSGTNWSTSYEREHGPSLSSSKKITLVFISTRAVPGEVELTERAFLFLHRFAIGGIFHMPWRNY